MLRQIQKLFAMDARTWARHTNPVSVWSRLLTLPIPFCIIWYRDVFGGMTWAMLALTLVWFWLNPRLFSEPDSRENWASQSILGECLWLRPDRPKPRFMQRLVSNITHLIGGIGLIAAATGLVIYEAWAVIIGVALMLVAKILFLDVMVRYWRQHSGGEDSPLMDNRE